MDSKEIIRKWEGLRLKAYLCPAGIPTIGYGHTFGVKLGQTIDKSQAEVFLDHDYQEAEEAVQTLVRVPLKLEQLAALTSFVFNLGPTALSKSTLLKKLNAKDFAGAANEFDKWVYGKVNGVSVKLPGLVARRADEKNLFLKGG